jgi:hypothetical protein
MRAIVVAGCIALSLFVSTPAEAQRGIGGMGGMGGGRRRGGGGGEARAARGDAEVNFPSASDLQRFNPAQLIVDKRKKVSLADSQVTALNALRGKIFERNAELLARYDSIRKDYHPPRAQDRNRTGSTPETDSARVASLSQMRTLSQLIDSLSRRRTADVGDVLNYLTDEKQHRAAVELLNEQDRDFTDKLPRLPGAGRGGRAGRQPQG